MLPSNLLGPNFLKEIDNDNFQTVREDSTSKPKPKQVRIGQNSKQTSPLHKYKNYPKKTWPHSNISKFINSNQLKDSSLPFTKNFQRTQDQIFPPSTSCYQPTNTFNELPILIVSDRDCQTELNTSDSFLSSKSSTTQQTQSRPDLNKSSSYFIQGSYIYNKPCLTKKSKPNLKTQTVSKPSKGCFFSGIPLKKHYCFKFDSPNNKVIPKPLQNIRFNRITNPNLGNLNRNIQKSSVSRSFSEEFQEKRKAEIPKNNSFIERTPFNQYSKSFQENPSYKSSKKSEIPNFHSNSGSDCSLLPLRCFSQSYQIQSPTNSVFSEKVDVSVKFSVSQNSQNDQKSQNSFSRAYKTNQNYSSPGNTFDTKLNKDSKNNLISSQFPNYNQKEENPVKQSQLIGTNTEKFSITTPFSRSHQERQNYNPSDRCQNKISELYKASKSGPSPFSRAYQEKVYQSDSDKVAKSSQYSQVAPEVYSSTHQERQKQIPEILFCNKTYFTDSSFSRSSQENHSYNPCLSNRSSSSKTKLCESCKDSQNTLGFSRSYQEKRTQNCPCHSTKHKLCPFSRAYQENQTYNPCPLERSVSSIKFGQEISSAKRSLSALREINIDPQDISKLYPYSKEYQGEQNYNYFSSDTHLASDNDTDIQHSSSKISPEYFQRKKQKFDDYLWNTTDRDKEHLQFDEELPTSLEYRFNDRTQEDFTERDSSRVPFFHRQANDFKNICHNDSVPYKPILRKSIQQFPERDNLYHTQVSCGQSKPCFFNSTLQRSSQNRPSLFPENIPTDEETPTTSNLTIRKQIEEQVGSLVVDNFRNHFSNFQSEPVLSSFTQQYSLPDQSNTVQCFLPKDIQQQSSCDQCCHHVPQHVLFIASQMDQVYFHQDRFEILVDARSFAPENIKVNVYSHKIELNVLTENADYGTPSKIEMTRSYQLPQPVCPEKGFCFLQCGGVLVISAPWATNDSICNCSS